MTHALIIDGEVATVGLPGVWRWPDGRVTVAFPAATAEVIRAAGWLPLVDDRPALADGETWGPPAYTVAADSVTVTADVIPAPTPGTTDSERLAAVEDAVDTLILDRLGGL